jgi:hypothetical protein
MPRLAAITCVDVKTAGAVLPNKTSRREPISELEAKYQKLIKFHLKYSTHPINQ